MFVLYSDKPPLCPPRPARAAAAAPLASRNTVQLEGDDVSIYLSAPLYIFYIPIIDIDI